MTNKSQTLRNKNKTELTMDDFHDYKMYERPEFKRKTLKKIFEDAWNDIKICFSSSPSSASSSLSSPSSDSRKADLKPHLCLSIAEQLDENLRNAEMTTFNKVENKLFKKNVKALAKLSDEEFVTYMKGKGFSRNYVHILIELILINFYKGDNKKRLEYLAQRKNGELKDDKIYTKLHELLKEQKLKNQNGSNSNYIHLILLTGVLYALQPEGILSASSYQIIKKYKLNIAIPVIVSGAFKLGADIISKIKKSKSKSKSVGRINHVLSNTKKQIYKAHTDTTRKLEKAKKKDKRR